MYFLLQICFFSDSPDSDRVWSLLLRQVFGLVLEACRGLKLLVMKVCFRSSSDVRSCVPVG